MEQTVIIIQTAISFVLFVGFMFLEGKIQKKTLRRKIIKVVLGIMLIIAGAMFISGIISLLWK